jgi:hypothetical protein
MNEKILFFLLIAVLVFVGVHFWENPEEKSTEESIVRSVAEDFGRSLKNVSLLSPSAPQEMEENYKDLLDPVLLSQWQEDPAKAVGRSASSPWPESIEILSVEKFGSGSYEVEGEIIEMTSSGESAKRPIKLSVSEFGEKWLITGVVLEKYGISEIASQLEECLPKSDWVSHEKCLELLKEIRNFEECVAVGFPATETDPPQCSLIDGRTFTRETNSTWEMAELAVSNCGVEKAFQRHDKIVTLTLKNGSELIVAEPKIDEIISIIEEVEPECGKVPIATE